MLHVPVKKTDEVDFTLPFKAYIQVTKGLDWIYSHG